MLGVLAGSMLGARQLIGARVQVLRWIFAGRGGVMAVEMIVSGYGELLDGPGTINVWRHHRRLLSDGRAACRPRWFCWAESVYLAGTATKQAEYHVFHGAAQTYRSLSGVIHAAGPSDWPAVIQLGLLLLILTPVARVAFCAGRLRLGA